MISIGGDRIMMMSIGNDVVDAVNVGDGTPDYLAYLFTSTESVMVPASGHGDANVYIESNRNWDIEQHN